jgi:hypothetical protein
LTRLGEASDDLVRNIGSEIDTESEGHVVEPNNISELFAACNLQKNMSHLIQACTTTDSYLVFFQPPLQELLPALLKHGARKFDGLEMIELAFLEKDTEVLQNG